MQVCLTCGCILFPLCLIRTLNGVRYFSLLSLSCLTITVIVVTAELYFYVNEFWAVCKYEDHDKVTRKCEIRLARWTPEIFNGAGIVFFAFTN